MGITFRIDPARNLVVVCSSGPTTMADFRAYAAALRQDPLYGEHLQILWEMDGDQPNIKAAEWREYRDWVKDKPRIRRIAVVGKSDLEYGSARLGQVATHLPDQTLKVFRTRAEALTWLGVPDTEDQ